MSAAAQVRQLVPQPAHGLPELPHDAALEPSDETVAEVQSLVCKSRQLQPELTPDELLAAMEGALYELMVRRPDAGGYAVALATMALRYREECCP